MPNSPFFGSLEERPWSRIKDRILGSYMSPYMAKVSKRGKNILIVDAFAGPGKTDDGEPGSPLLICQAAEKYAQGKYRAIFADTNRKYHEQLKDLLSHAGYKYATPILGDGRDLLKAVRPILGDRSVFLYIDPFGLDCEFDIIEPFLNRDKSYSTEIFIILHAPILHRMAGRDAYLDGTGDQAQLAERHEKLTRTLGGDYWKEALLSRGDMSRQEREELVVNEYRRRLASTNYLRFTGACPIQEKSDSVTKYYMVFAAPHIDALKLLNDIMCDAFNSLTHEREFENTLFSDLAWTEWRDTTALQRIIVENIQRKPNRTRDAYWEQIIQDHFMRFKHPEHVAAVKELVEKKRILCTTPVDKVVGIRKTKRLNGNCRFIPNS